MAEQFALSRAGRVRCSAGLGATRLVWQRFNAKHDVAVCYGFHVRKCGFRTQTKEQLRGFFARVTEGSLLNVSQQDRRSLFLGNLDESNRRPYTCENCGSTLRYADVLHPLGLVIE